MTNINSNINAKTNPIDKEETLQAFFENDASYNQVKRNQFQNFKYYFLQKNSNSNLNFMSRIFKIISTHSTAFIIGLVLAGSAVGASAAQLVAPENLKPSTLFQELFKANKQVDKNPYTALTPDKNNSVAILKDCNLAIKYPTYVNQQQFEITTSKTLATALAKDKKVFNLSNIPSADGVKSNMMIQCYSGKLSDDFPTYSGIGSEPKEISSESLIKETGWFILAEHKIDKIYQLASNFGYLGDKEIFFTFENLNYHIIYNSVAKADNQNPIKANQVQLQFSSLVKNISNAEVKVNQELPAANSSSSPSESPTNVKVITPSKPLVNNLLESTPNLSLEPVKKNNFEFERYFRNKDPNFLKLQCGIEDNESYSFKEGLKPGTADNFWANIKLTSETNNRNYEKLVEYKNYDYLKKAIQEKSLVPRSFDIAQSFSPHCDGAVGQEIAFERINNFALSVDIKDASYTINQDTQNNFNITIFGSKNGTDYLLQSNSFNLPTAKADTTSQRGDCINNNAEAEASIMSLKCSKLYPLTSEERAMINQKLKTIQSDYGLTLRK